MDSSKGLLEVIPDRSTSQIQYWVYGKHSPVQKAGSTQHLLVTMFSSQEYLDKKTGPSGVGRLQYLQSLVTEFQDTDKEDCKEQVLANLANFAYDPINYEHLRKLNVIDMFLDSLTEENERLVEFGIGGLCNLALDKQNKEHILASGGVDLVIQCLSSRNEETVLNAITTLMFLTTPASKPAITSLSVVECMLRFQLSKNSRLSNLATVFLEDYCSRQQVEAARQAQTGDAVGIALPSEPQET